MAVVEKSILLQRISDLEIDDNVKISLMEDIADTMSDENWEERLRENDEMWRQRYKERFLTGKEKEEKEKEKDVEDVEVKTSYEDLFKS